MYCISSVLKISVYCAVHTLNYFLILFANFSCNIYFYAKFVQAFSCVCAVLFLKYIFSLNFSCHIFFCFFSNTPTLFSPLYSVLNYSWNINFAKYAKLFRKKVLVCKNSWNICYWIWWYALPFKFSWHIFFRITFLTYLLWCRKKIFLIYVP